MLKVVLHLVLSKRTQKILAPQVGISKSKFCLNIDNNLDESESDIFQSAPTQDDNNRDGGITIRDFNNENNNCNDRSTTYINQGEGENKIGDVNFD
jgi:hypothetical protein